MALLLKLAVAFAVGYYAVTKAAPMVQSKIQSLDLDNAWDVFDSWDGR